MHDLSVVCFDKPFPYALGSFAAANSEYWCKMSRDARQADNLPADI